MPQDCLLTTAERDGTLVTRPMGLQQAEDGGTLWFLTRATSDVGSPALLKRRPSGAVGV